MIVSILTWVSPSDPRGLNRKKGSAKKIIHFFQVRVKTFLKLLLHLHAYIHEH